MPGKLTNYKNHSAASPYISCQKKLEFNGHATMRVPMCPRRDVVPGGILHGVSDTDTTICRSVCASYLAAEGILALCIRGCRSTVAQNLYHLSGL